MAIHLACYKGLFQIEEPSTKSERPWKNGSLSAWKRSTTKKNGETYWSELSITPIADETGWFTHWVSVQRDISERKENEFKLKKLTQELQCALKNEQDINSQLELFDAAISHAKDGVIITSAEPIGGPEGPKIVYVNDSFTRITGYSKEEAIGNTPRMLQGPLSDRKTLDTIRVALEKWQPVAVEVLNYRKDGQTFWSELSIVPIADETGWFTHWVSIQRNITERKESELKLKKLSQDLNRALTSAQEAVVAKGQFLATMSHEIRTPMNGVLGMASLLMDTRLDEEQIEYVQTITNSGEQLLLMINDILEYSKIKSGHLDLELRPFDLTTHIRSVLGSFVAQIGKKPITLDYYCAPDVPQHVIGDSGRLRQILVNLISNAIKFTDAGSIKVSVTNSEQELKQAGIQQNKIQISISDTGIGIAPENQKNLFESFTQADASIARKHGGTGLGLAICKRLTEIMGGKIWIESTLNKGSTFYFTISLAPVEPDDSEPEETDQQGPIEESIPLLQDWTGKKALIVDSNPAHLKKLDHLLKQFGFFVAAKNYDHIISSKNSQLLDVDIVFVDIFSSSPESFDLIRYIQQQKNNTSLPSLIGLINDANEDAHTHCLLNGLQDSLGTPFTKNKLITLLNSVHLSSQLTEDAQSATYS